MKQAFKGYYFITDVKLSRAGNAGDVRQAALAGVPVVQYRNKEGDTRRLYEEARALKDLCPGVLFLVNDRIDIALAIDADGVHIGRDDMPYAAARKLLGPGKVIGVTVHTVAEAREAENQGADYLGVSPIFATTTKADAGQPAGIQLLKDIKAHCRLPLAAIGGITLGNAPEVVAAGADMVCAISAVVASDDVKGMVGKFQGLFKK